MDHGDGDDFEYLGPALAALRTVRRKTVKAVSKELNISASVLSRCEKGERDLSTRELFRYLKIVNASLEDLHLAMGVLKFTRSLSDPKSDHGEARPEESNDATINDATDK